MLVIHPENPQLRLIRQVVEVLRDGQVVVYPTDSSYALGAAVGAKQAMETIGRIRQVDQRHNYTLVCSDIAQAAQYAKMNNVDFRLVRTLTPGPYTFILTASREVPRRLLNPKRKTIGIRIPDHPVALALLAELGEPILSSTLILPGEEYPMTDPWEIEQLIGHQVGQVVDGGYCGLEPTTVVDLTGEQPEVIRVGQGDVSLFA